MEKRSYGRSLRTPRPESPPYPKRCPLERSGRQPQKQVRSWSGGGPESPHHPGVSGPLAGVSALMLPIYKRSSCRHNQMRVRSGSGGTPEFPHGPESPHSQGGVSAPNFSGMLVGAGRQPQKSIRSFAGVSAPVRSLRTGSAETPH